MKKELETITLSHALDSLNMALKELEKLRDELDQYQWDLLTRPELYDEETIKLKNYRLKLKLQGALKGLLPLVRLES